MNNNSKNIYKGFNPIFESISDSLKEDSKTKKENSPSDVVSSISTALNTVFSILMNSKNESAKTPRGFEEIKNKILGSNNFGSFRQYIVSLIQSFAALDLQQKGAYEKNLKYIIDLLSGNTESALSDPKIYDSLRKDIITKLLTNFSQDLKDREAQMRKTNPKLFGEVVKQGLVVKENEEIVEDKKTGDETDVSDAEFRGAAFNKSKESLDAASSFVGMIDRDKYVPVLKDNEDIKRFKGIADNLYKQAQDLQMTDRGGSLGGKIVTPTGDFSSRDYKRKQDSLLNEIIRNKKEYTRIKDGILKNNNITPTPPVIPVCPPGKVYDEAKGICVDSDISKEEEDTKRTKPKKIKSCEFPIQIGTRCKEVGIIQSKLMEILPSVAEYLPKYGGADNKYGKATAKCVNIIYSYISKEPLKIDGELSKDMYDIILGLTSDDIDKNCYNTVTPKGADVAKESLSLEMTIQNKIEEREEIKGSPILSFEDFYSVIEESYNFIKLDEQSIENLFKVDKPKRATDPNQIKPTKKLIDCCVKDSILSNTLVNCKGATGGGETGGGETGGTGDKIIWKGFKPVNDGAYTIYYDESWGEWFDGAAKGALVAGIIAGAVIVTGGAAAGIIIPAGGGALLGSAGAAGSMLATGATVSGGLTLAAGAIGGATIAKWAGNDRKPVTILVFNGYIEEIAVKAMARGLYNSLGGTVSSQDLLAIYSTLLLCRGTFTGDTKAVPVWKKIKSKYASFGGGSLEKDLASIASGGVGGFFKDIVTDMDTIPGFPKSFKTKNPTDSSISVEFEDAKEACLSAISKLNSNERKLSANLKNISKEDLEMLSDSMEEITSVVDEKVKD